MDSTIAHVGGLPLPEALVVAINSGQWTPPDVSVLKNVFGDEPDGPMFYDLESMEGQNRFFRRTSREEFADLIPASKDGLGIDPALALIIGSLGADMPIALDYRLSRSTPRVIYLSVGGWREVAPNFNNLLARLTL